jgi:peptidoglycan/LPS O-acetylase OafA/YrhL
MMRTLNCAARGWADQVFKLLAFASPPSAAAVCGTEPRPLSSTSGGTGNLRYLPFVDGLRAVSILAVVAYHVGLPGVPGGFIGVDIFFVISGFLIINQIKSGLEAGRYSIWMFYAQRALRILPPYFIMLLVVYAAAPFFLSTTEVYWDFLSSAVTAPLMVTNVTFYLTQGYFDIAAIEKPLLHTWSLAVEEQFYWLAPVLLLAVFRLGGGRFGRLSVVIGLLLATASLIGAIAETDASGRNAAFYLPQWRGWEFLLGGLIGGQLVAAIRRFPRIGIELVAWIGAGCIALAIGALKGFVASDVI